MQDEFTVSSEVKEADCARPCLRAQGMRDTYRLLSAVLRQRMAAALPALAAAPGAVPEPASAAAGAFYFPGLEVCLMQVTHLLVD